MSVAQRWVPMLGLLVSASCGSTDETPSVVFGQGTQVGTWAVSAAGHAAVAPRAPAAPAAAGAPLQTAPVTGAAGASNPGSVTPPVGPAAPAAAAASGSPAVLPPPSAAGAPAGPTATAGRGAPGPGLPVAGMPSAAGSGGPGLGAAGGGPASGGPVTSLTFDVTTTPVGGRYQPKNVGAIWIQNSSGDLVKSLQVWAGIRRIWLTTYGGVLGFGGAVDVMASATMTSHKAHHVTWDLKDKSGAAVPPGKYTLMMELTDSDAPGRTSMLTFDTSAGAMMMTPPDAPSFTKMMLQLQ